MKGVILAGGEGTRLLPLTLTTNKHLLPITSRRQMILWPLEKLVQQGIEEVMIVSGKGHAGHFADLLGYGTNIGELLGYDHKPRLKLNYAVQEKAGGIAEALSLAEDFSDGDSLAVVLGDNIYQRPLDTAEFNSGARIYLKIVNDPGRFGVATIAGKKVVKIIEKPKEPETNFAVTGFYLYDHTVFDKIRRCHPSPPPRSELEITEVNNMYVAEGGMQYRMVRGFWSDAGTRESYAYAFKEMERRTTKRSSKK
jgi:glucose-1-phosphate thymidylyltransferase